MPKHEAKIIRAAFFLFIWSWLFKEFGFWVWIGLQISKLRRS